MGLSTCGSENESMTPSLPPSLHDWWLVEKRGNESGEGKGEEEEPSGLKVKQALHLG